MQKIEFKIQITDLITTIVSIVIYRSLARYIFLVYHRAIIKMQTFWLVADWSALKMIAAFFYVSSEKEYAKWKETRILW